MSLKKISAYNLWLLDKSCDVKSKKKLKGLIFSGIFTLKKKPPFNIKSHHYFFLYRIVFRNTWLDYKKLALLLQKIIIPPKYLVD